MKYITFLTGIAISAVAAYYSIIGLTTIFAGAFWPVVIIGSVLEVGKLVSTSWLYNNWKVAPFFIKSYLMVAITVLMLITSMGIFGFLSKAHIEQSLSLNTGVIDQVQVVDNQIRFVEDTIKDLDKQIAQIDAAVSKMTERNQAQSSLAAADKQRKNRTDLTNRKQVEVKKLSDLKSEKIKYEAEYKKVEAEIGPIKYVAELVYGGSDREVVDKAIRFVIILLIFVFDPLAVLLLLAFNISANRDNIPEFMDMSEVSNERIDGETVGNLGSDRPRAMVQDQEVDNKS